MVLDCLPDAWTRRGVFAGDGRIAIPGLPQELWVTDDMPIAKRIRGHLRIRKWVLDTVPVPVGTADSLDPPGASRPRSHFQQTFPIVMLSESTSTGPTAQSPSVAHAKSPPGAGV